jgi:hypothetical protein
VHLSGLQILRWGCSKRQVSGVRFQVSGFGLRVARYGLRGAGIALQDTRCALRGADFIRPRHRIEERFVN